MPPDLVLIPNNADVITNGEQWIARSLLAPFLAAAAEFHAEAGVPVYVAEAYRSDAAQRAIFLARYVRVSYPTGIRYDGSYWIKRYGMAVAAVPGSEAAKHRKAEALDLWSGIDTSFTSRNHLIWVRVAKKHGFENTGRNFGEPWHQQGTPGVSPAGLTPTPIAPSEEDDMIHILFLKAANGGRGIVGSGYNQGFKNLDERNRVMAPLYRLLEKGEVKITEVDVTVDEFRQQLWATTPDDVDTIKQSQGRVEAWMRALLGHFKIKA